MRWRWVNDDLYRLPPLTPRRTGDNYWAVQIWPNAGWRGWDGQDDNTQMRAREAVLAVLTRPREPR